MSASSAGLAAADFILAGIIITLAGAFWLEREFTPRAVATMAAFVVGGQLLSLTYWPRSSNRPSWLFVKILAGNLLAAGLYWVLRGQFGGLVSRPTFATMLAVLLPLQAIFHLRSRAPARQTEHGSDAEYLRWALGIAATLLFHRPLLTTGSVGAGDAYWYNIMTADFVSQWRAGVFPVFAGQTEFAFNGAINPLRFAPGLQHLAGVMDLLTARSLTFHGLLNLTLVASYVGSTLTCYICLRAVERQAPWLALILSLLYGLCPGLLALVYTGDLFMSVTALPFVPVLLYGAWRTLAIGDLKGTLLMVSAAAALWYFHPPIAFWGTILAAVTQLVRLPREWRERRTWKYWSIGVAVFVALSLYCFVSVRTTGIPAYPAYRPVLIENLVLAFPHALKPVSKSVVQLGDYQLGWTLWAALAVGCLGVFAKGSRRPSLGLMLASLLLLVLLAPVPNAWLLTKLWMTVPQAVCDITFMWPMQRFYVFLAALATLTAFVALAPFSVRHSRWGLVVLLALIGGGYWSRLELLKFHRHAKESTTAPPQAVQQLLPQNRVLTRYAFNPFREVPPYISHGYIDPLLTSRLLATDNFAELASNTGALEHDAQIGTIRAEGVLTARRPDPTQPSLAIEPSLRLEPNRRYALKFEFAHPEFVGALKIIGPRLSRLYWMPDSAYDTKPIAPSRAFAALPGRPHAITLWTDGSEAENVSLQFFFTAEAPTTEIKTFGRYQLIEFDPAKLPIQVEKWAPYRVHFSTPSPGFLETPRMFLQGYQARVNGRKVEVARSPSALVMVPVLPGENRVEVSYPGTWALRTAYFFSLLSWMMLLSVWLLSAVRTRLHRPHAA